MLNRPSFFPAIEDKHPHDEKQSTSRSLDENGKCRAFICETAIEFDRTEKLISALLDRFGRYKLRAEPREH